MHYVIQPEMCKDDMILYWWGRSRLYYVDKEEKDDQNQTTKMSSQDNGPLQRTACFNVMGWMLSYHIIS